MTWRAIVMVEEESARLVVEGLARRLAIDHLLKVIPHEGKSDLERSIPRKIAGWRSPRAPRFLVARDGPADARDALKAKLMALVPEPARSRTRIRIVVHELESWFLGDPTALVAAGLATSANAERKAHKLAQRNLCILSNPVQELHKIVGERGKIGLARAIAPHLDPMRNTAASFASFVAALRWAAEEKI